MPSAGVLLVVAICCVLGTEAIPAPLGTAREVNAPTEVTHENVAQLQSYADTDNATTIKCQDISSHADPCAFVQNTDSCGDMAGLVNYLSFHYCTSAGTPWSVISTGLMLCWVGLLISLLATTADIFFIPPLNYLSDFFNLSPAVAGITLLAFGNGAPDIFTALAAVSANEFSLTLGALTGASICISSFILGTVLLNSEKYRDDPSKKVRKEDFIRDIGVYITAVTVIVCICLDGSIYIYEAAGLLVVYFFYVSTVVFMSRRDTKRALEERLLTGVTSESPEASLDDEEDDDVLQGLTWRSSAPVGEKVQYVMEFPFSVLRWLSVPSSGAQWGPARRKLASCCFFPFACVFTVGFYGFEALTATVPGGSFPILVIVGAVCCVLSAIAYYTSNDNEPPVYSSLYALIAFAASVVWLNILAGECVAVLSSLGVMWNVSTGILGLTVLAVGNSVGDFVADNTVARKGVPATAIAACFGSPLMNDVVGLGLCLTVTTAKSYPEPFTFHLDRQVPVAWGFLYLTLISSIIVFPMSNYRPSTKYAAYLMAIYITFMIVSILVAIFWAGNVY